MAKTTKTQSRVNRRQPQARGAQGSTAAGNEAIRTKAELRQRLAGIPASARKAVVCALVGHSRIQTHCFGYFNCARCGAQVGDALASVYPEAANVVLIGHDCTVCRKNAKTLTWRDRFMAPDPFAKAKAS